MSQARAHRPGPVGSGQSRAPERPLVMLARQAGEAAALASAVDCTLSPEILDVVREAYGRTTYGQGCLLARRLVEAGSKLVTVYFSESIGGQSTESQQYNMMQFRNCSMFLN